MVSKHWPGARSGRGMTILEVAVAASILGIAVTAFAGIHWSEQKMARECYYRAVSMQIVDGEMERLVAGEWKAYAEGSHEYDVIAESAGNLPPGRFMLTVGKKSVRLEWVPAHVVAGSPIMREAAIR